jgi:hypothetical protein
MIATAKAIVFFGKPKSLSCDGRCDKAWGIELRPRLYYMEAGPCEPRALRPGEEPRDLDDYVYLPDAALGTAPADPGTTEGFEAKPFAVRIYPTQSHLMNKWCARQCERSRILEPGRILRRSLMEAPRPNDPKRGKR